MNASLQGFAAAVFGELDASARGLAAEELGRLDQTAGRLDFTYDAGWLGRPHAVPLSASLPLQEKAFDDRAARPFFAGLLPEQDRRDQVARTIGVSGPSSWPEAMRKSSE